jgi:hypothetical protein
VTHCLPSLTLHFRPPSSHLILLHSGHQYSEPLNTNSAQHHTKSRTKHSLLWEWIPIYEIIHYIWFLLLLYLLKQKIAKHNILKPNSWNRFSTDWMKETSQNFWFQTDKKLLIHMHLFDFPLFVLLPKHCKVKILMASKVKLESKIYCLKKNRSRYM